jgi:predicted metal-dependent hydrolase
MQLRRVHDIQYQLLPGTQRRTTDIVIERDGVVQVRPPQRMTPEQVDETVYSRRQWIYRNLAEWHDLNASQLAREWVNGETFLYLGSGYRLLLVEEQDEPLKLKDGRFQLLRSVVRLAGRLGAERAFVDWYRQKGQSRIAARVAHHAARVAVEPRAVEVRELGFRWASCPPSGNLHFHWKCMMAPLTVIDYIVVHELCHLRHGDHSAAFWNEVDKAMPDYRERKEWLRQHGAGLSL